MQRSAVMMFSALALTTGLVTSLTACKTMPPKAADVPPVLAAAVADSARPAADAARDAHRKPAQVLAFAGIPSGAQIAELLPGEGYYTRLLSVVTGAGGHVYELIPPPGPDGKDHAAPIKALAADARYSNVTVQPPLSYTAHAMGLPQPVDVVWTTDNYHDMHNALGRAGMQNFNKHIYEALQPGGVFLVLDHGRGARPWRQRYAYLAPYRSGNRQGRGDRSRLPVRRQQQCAAQSG
ncbi:MAG: hypothetical protein LBV61_08095 [Burkholderiaceae bacterium]|jgi:predicted methyltransferase|nr:hypothetical protein [Burkholderiaceae bacterium]